MVVKKLTVGNQAITRREVKFPSGKTIVLRTGMSYTTCDPEELEFARTLKGIQIRDVQDSDLRAFISKLPDIPTVDKVISKDEAKRYFWHDEDEDYVMDYLKKNGYLKEESSADPEEIKQAKLKLRFNKISDEDIIKELIRRSETGVLDQKIIESIKSPSDNSEALKQGLNSSDEIDEEVLFAKMKSLGYIGWRKSSKA